MLLKDRRKNSFLRTGKRFNFNRRKHNRLPIGEFIEINDNIKVELINIVNEGLCISSHESLNTETLKLDLNPYFNLCLNGNIIWQEEDKENNKFTYGIKFIDVDKSTKEYLKDQIILNNEFFIEHAKFINSKVKNIENKNKIMDFFVKDVKKALENYIKLDKMVSEKQDKNLIYRKTQETIDSLLIKGEILSSAINDQAIVKDIKQRVRVLVGPFMYRSETIRRGLEKPKGYPGDYQMLEMVYNNIELSEGLGKYLDRYFLDDGYASAVRCRKNMMREILIEEILKYEKPSINILNLASGSLREIRDILNKKRILKKNIDFYAIDFDKDSLEFSKENISKFNTKEFNVRYIQDNILKLDSIEAIKNKEFDLIYSIGIADYLQDRMLKKIFTDCFNMLKIGSKFIIAYKDMDKYKPLPANWYCDWNFVPRNEKQFLNIIKQSIGRNNINIEIKRENTGIIFFAIITKL